MSRFLRFCAFLSVLFFTSNLMAAGYTCNTTPTYTSCKEGYYLEACGTDSSDWSGQTATPVTGKTCLECPDGYVCEGEQKCPVRDGINCAAGTYIKKNTTTCTACPSGNYCPGITTDSATSTSSDRGITQCPEGSYCPARSSSPKSCPTNYGNSAAGSDAQSDCYTSCGAGAVVTVPKTACTTPAGAWYSSEGHIVYYGSISPIGYCPLGSDSHNGVASLHDQVADCLVTVPAGYSSTVTTSTARYIRISSETGTFPLAEIQAYNSATQLSLALGSSVTNGANALDGSLTTQAIVSTESGVGAYATFDLGSAKMITDIKFALGNVTSGYNIVIAISSDNSNWTTVFNQTVYGVSALPGVLQNVPLNTRTNTKCAAGTYHGSTTVAATNGVTCTACPTAICNGETNCASGFSTHRNTYPENYHSGDNLKLVKTWFSTSSNTGNTSIEECKLSYTYTNNRGTFNQDSVRYQSSTGRYDGVGGVVYYTVLNPGYYGSGKLSDTYCDTDTNTRRHYYQDAVLCPAGKYCSGYTQMPLCSSGTYNDTMGIDGLVSVGYYSTGGGTSATPTASGNGCIAGQKCGTVAAGYYSSAGAKSETGDGEVYAGYWNDGCGINATGGVCDITHKGGQVNAGYWNDGCGINATGGVCNTSHKGGLVNAGYWNDGCGINATAGVCNTTHKGGQVNPGYYNLGGGTSATPEVRGNGCANVSTTQCGTVAPGYWGAAGATQYGGSGAVAPGYYSTGGATSNTPSASDCAGKVAIIENGKLMGASDVNNTCGQVQAGYWNNACGINATGGVCSTSYQGGIIAAGYWGTAGATDSVGSGLLTPGYYSTGGATSEYPDPNQCVGNNTCGAVAAGYWNNGGGTSANGTCVSGKSCGTVNGGYYSTGGGTSATPTAAGNGCLANKLCGKLSAIYYSNGGSTSDGATCVSGKTCGTCDANYRANTETGKTSVNQCQASCAAGTRVAAINAACTSPAGGWFSAAHLVNYGQISPVNYCMSGYTSASTSASGHDAATDCVQTIAGGKYVPSSKINARYIKITSDGSVSVSGSTNPSTHLLEMQAFASSDGTGTNLLSGKGAVAGDKMSAVTNGNWTRGDGYSYGEGSPMILDLGSVQALGSLKFAMYTDGREYQNVAIAVSEDNTTYTTVFTATKLLTQNTTTPTGELVVLSAVPKSCALGTYKVSGSLALTNTSSCNAAQAGYFVGTTGASSQTKCVMGSYTDTTGQSACKACAGGKTNSADGATSCTATCSNATGVASTGWETPVWGTDNKMTNLCTIKATAGCSAKYYKNSNACLMCPDGYQDGGAGYTQISQCTMNVAGGKYVAVANESSPSGTCDLGTYKPAHLVTYGKTSSCIPCPNATYADQEGMSACEACPTATKYADKVVSYGSNKKARSGCSARFEDTVKNGETTYFSCYLRSGDDYGTLTSGANCWTHGARTKCDAGYYSPVVPSAQYDEMWYANLESVVNNICKPVESGYWSGADSLTRTACETGLVTCGAGLCANEAGDCGRKLHAGDNVIYLRSQKRTGVSPLLHVKMKMEDASGKEVDRLFYGNMSTTLSGPLKVKYNNTKYSVVNDNQ